MAYRTLLIPLLFACAALTGQSSIPEPETDWNEQNRQRDQLHRQNLLAVFQSEGAYMITNPAPWLEADPERVYLRTAWQPLTVKRRGGGEIELTGRYRLVDQKFELRIDGEDYELFNHAWTEARLGNDRFVVLADHDGFVIYQVYYESDGNYVLTHHTSEWQAARKASMLDTAEPKRMLSKREELYLRTPAGMTKVRNKRQVYAALGIDRASEVYRTARRRKLKPTTVAGLTALLQLIAAQTR